MPSDRDRENAPRAKRGRPRAAKLPAGVVASGKVRKQNSEPRRERYHHGDLKRALLDATLQLVEERGPQGFTLRGAAKAAGVTPGASYHHFDDKDALLAGVAEEGFEMFEAALREAALQPAPNARERSHNVGAAYVLFAVKHPTRFRIMVGYGVQSRLERGRLGTNAIATYKLVRNALIQGRRNENQQQVPEAEVLGWWSVVHGLSFLAIDGHLGKAAASSKGAQMMVRHVLEALDKRS